MKSSTTKAKPQLMTDYFTKISTYKNRARDVSLTQVFPKQDHPEIERMFFSLSTQQRDSNPQSRSFIRRRHNRNVKMGCEEKTKAENFARKI